ncbi:MAG TPA: flippase-like domain-containing protein, partial [Acidimicrobiia bacterium]|nr:flippase-like domain-containing protein [Acidimicrobiia bacterium]
MSGGAATLETPPTSRLRRLLVGAIAAVLIGVAFFGLLPALADYDEVWRAISGIGPGAIAVLVVAGAASLALGPLPTMVVIPALRFGRALYSRMVATTAANTIPGGGAIGVGITYVMLGRWGHTAAEIGASVALTGVWNNLARMVLPAAALAAAVIVGVPMPGLVGGALIGVAAVAVSALAIVVVLRSRLKHVVLRPIDRLVRWVRRRRGRMVDPVDSPSQRFLDVVGQAVGTRWFSLMLTTLVYHLSLYACLEVALRVVGVTTSDLHWTEVLAAFSLVRLVSAVPLTPGSLGITEVGLTGLMTTGMDTEHAALVAAGVLVFRFVTYAVPTVAGAIAAIGWSRSKAKKMRPGRWGSYPPDHFEDAVCFRCRVPGIERWQLDQFALVACPQCGQAFMSPRLNHEGRLNLYGARAYFDSGVYKTAGAKGLQRTWAEGRLDLIDSALGNGQRRSMFEVGCAYGMFLEAAKERGYAVAGLEFSAVAAGVASERLGTTIHVGEVVDLPPADHDVVAFWDTIEHVPDPRAFLDAAVALIRPGGIVALSCPRFDSLAARVLRKRWWTLKPHKHIWHFTRSDLRRLLAETGLEEIRMVSNP